MPDYKQYRQHAEEIFTAALAAADPGRAVRRALRRSSETIHIGPLQSAAGQGRIFVVSVGKAALPMAAAALDILQDAFTSAHVISKRGGQGTEDEMLRQDPRVFLMEGSHPLPGQDSVQATTAVIEQLSQAVEEDLVLFLISGGTSALLTQPVVSLAAWQLLTDALLASGCTINELNTVRRQLDSVKGGGLARIAAPARCISLILSDVVGNPLPAIGSGPTIPLSESPADALRVLDRYEIEGRIGQAAYARIAAALHREEEHEAEASLRSEIIIVGDVRQAAEAARAKALALDFDARLMTVHLEGEAREVGRFAAAIAKDTSPDTCLIFGGETTVTLRGDGVGGRNLETALSAAIAVAGWPSVAIASAATDGEDGPTPAAGAVVSGWTAPYAADNGLPPQAYLHNNDSYHFFAELDRITSLQADQHGAPPCLLLTGSTGTNVNDLLFILTYEPDDA